MEHLNMDSEPSPLHQVYQPLDSGRFQIRCLSLSPGEFEDPICGALEIVSLEDRPKYEAISYVWGQDLSPVPMVINNANVSITQNLDTALRHLRHRDSSRRLWVDALCINQADLKEKAEQVKYMGLIYSHAAKAIVWLGSADTSLQPVKDFLNDLDLKRNYLRSFASESKEPVPRRSKPNQNDPEFSLALRAQDRPTGVLRGLLELFSRPYWERVWIIQEISKASNVEIRFGQFRVHLNPLLLASRNLKNLSERTRTLLRAIVRFRAQEQGYGGLSTNARMSLFDALIASRHSLATDPRDKVYALIGLTNDGSNLIPMPTYTTSVEKVFHDLTAAIIRSQQRSNVILLANWASLQERFKDAARWCIDWADLGYHLPPWLTRLPRSVPEVISPRVDFNGPKLVTKGQFIATITQVQGTSRVTLASPAKYKPPLEEVARDILSQVTSDLLYRLAPGFRSTTRLSHTEITDALARMIRDVNKGEASADYDIGCVEDVLDQLGSLSWQRNPIWEWARAYNHARASEDSDDDDSTTTSTKAISTFTPMQESPQPDSFAKKTTSWLGWGRSRGVSEMGASRSAAGSPSSLMPPQTLSSKTLGAPWSPGPRPPPQPAFQFWEDVLSALDAVPEFKLRFALAQNHAPQAHLVLVCDGARPGDSIYQIEHSSLPVILRGRYENFDLIGEVCMSRQETGEWNMARFEADADDPFKAMVREPKSLNIMLGKKAPHRMPSYESLYVE
jgi:hypothetical protein